MDIVCEFGFLDLVQYLLSIHVREGARKQEPSPQDSMEELSIFSEAIKHRATTLNPEASLRTVSPYQPPIHRACEHGHIEIVQWLYRHFKGRPPPRDFDINTVDEKAGENCALVAARCGDLDMIKVLYEECKADFHVLNRRRENAIQVAVTGSKRRLEVSFLGCLRYLIEKVGVDVTYEYEETLLICEDKTLIFYLETQLHQHGILTSKSKVDLENSLTRNRPRRQMTKKSQELEQRCRQIGTKFLLRDLFADTSRGEDISSIPEGKEGSEGRDNSEERVTPF